MKQYTTKLLNKAHLGFRHTTFSPVLHDTCRFSRNGVSSRAELPSNPPPSPDTMSDNKGTKEGLRS